MLTGKALKLGNFSHRRQHGKFKKRDLTPKTISDCKKWKI